MLDIIIEEDRERITMDKRNLLKPGNTVSPAPLGIPTTIEYDGNGMIRNVYTGYEPTNDLKSKDLYSYIIKHSLVPTHLPTNNGTLYVKGVLYSGNEHIGIAANIPNDIINLLLDDIQDGIIHNFFAAHLYSTALSFTNNTQIRNWLKINDFNLLPEFIVTYENSWNNIKTGINESPFKYEDIVGLFTFEGNLMTYMSLELQQCFVNGIKVFINEDGSVLADVLGFGVVDYYTLYKYNIMKNDTLLVDSNRQILHNFNKHAENIWETYTCDVCGAITYELTPYFKCCNKYCPSNMYFYFTHFSDRLNLPCLTHDTYEEYIKSGKITKLSDIFDLPEYRDLVVDTSIYDLMDAIIPVSEVRNRNHIWNLYSACNGSLESIIYYCSYPDKIKTDLKLDCDELVGWLSDSRNVNELTSIITYSNIVIVPVEIKQESAPVLRGLKIYLTGKFIRGSKVEIKSIIKRFGGEVADYDDANYCLIGEIKEDIDSSIVNSFRNKGCAINNEDSFFSHYLIDEELIQS